MKKVVGIILLFAVMISSSALAEVFTLHSGTQFGMSKEEVSELEKANGFVLEEWPVQEGLGRLKGEGTIASQPDSFLIYYFDSSDSLVRMKYKFFESNTYDSVENGLNKKYGETEYSSNTNLEFPLLHDSETQSLRIPFTSYSIGRFGSERTDYSHRLIETENGDFVFIEHYAELSRDPELDGSIKLNDSQTVDYHLLTDEDVKKICGNTTQTDDDL